MAESNIRKLEQGRAEFAYRCVSEALEKLDDKKQDDYRLYSKKLPTMLLTNGLGQMLAFVKSKAKDKIAYELLYNQMTSYLKSNTTARMSMPKDKRDLTEWAVSCNSHEYRLITKELLTFLIWLKRFAEGRIEE